MKQTMKNIFFTLGWLAILTGIVMSIVVTYWLVYPYKPIVFNLPILPVVNKNVRQGGTLRYISDYCKYMDTFATVTRTFENDLIFTTPTIITNRQDGCHVINVEISIPHELPPGTYHLRNVYTYQVNPMKKISVTQITEDFTVLEVK